MASVWRRVDLGAEFEGLFDSVRHGVWRWECQGDYYADHADVLRWQTGEPPVEDERVRAWMRYIQGLRTAGIPFQRVRMLSEPLTEYLEWMLDTTGRSIAAGEDIRWVGQDLAHELDMPDYDFYIFDDRVAILHFDDRRRLTSADLIDENDVVQSHRDLRDLIWQYAIPHQEFT
ncbi:MAG: DUF6879 family protein, partial [Sciscionella sp.]